eukprot:jgi/Hompol1/1409/HPOL_002345-RA
MLDKDVVTVIISNIDDDEAATRRACLDVLQVLLSSNLAWTGPLLKKIYPELLKRMDDAQDSLRIHCARVWQVYFESVAKWKARMAPLAQEAASRGELQLSVVPGPDEGIIEIALDTVHWETMVKGLTIHLDDTNSSIQDQVYNALAVGVKTCIPQQILRDHLTLVRNKHRSTRYIDDLLRIESSIS